MKTSKILFGTSPIAKCHCAACISYEPKITPLIDKMSHQKFCLSILIDSKDSGLISSASNV